MQKVTRLLCSAVFLILTAAQPLRANETEPQARSAEPVATAELAAGGQVYALAFHLGVWHWAYRHGWNPYGFSYWSHWNFAPAYASYGAIAYSPSTDQVGAAWGAASLYQARLVADRYCGAEDCATAVWVQGGCAALARGPDSSAILGVGYALNRRRAELSARTACRNSGGIGCRTRAWVCSY